MANTINVTSDTVVKLIIRRGTDADRQTIILASGELGYAIDTKRVYVGDGVTPGGNIVGNKNFGVLQGIERYSGIAQAGDIVFQNVKSSGVSDNTLYAFNNGQWVSIHPQYGSPFDYTTGALLFNGAYLSLDTTNSILNIANSLSAANALSANSVTIYSQPVFDTDGTNKLYVDTQIGIAEATDQQFTIDYVGNNYVPLSGAATMFGTLSSTVNMSVSTGPIVGADVTNKNYVDWAAAAALSAANNYTGNRFLPLSGGTLNNSVSSAVTRNDVPAVYIKQLGSAPALVVQDTNRATPQSFYVDNYGSVGIGVLPPAGSTQLTVLGTASASNVIAANVWINGIGDGFSAPAVDTVALYTAGTEVLRANASGNVGIGITSPQAKLDVTGNARITGNLTVNGAISATGDIIAFTTSDARLKLNVEPITSALDKIDNIYGVEYDWNTDLQNVHSGHDVGVLAQEIESVIPEAVITRADGYKAVNYDKIIPLLIQAIKELKANQQS